VNVGNEIYTALSANAPVAALIGTRIYPLLMPESVLLPAIVYQTVATTPQNGFSGNHGLDNVRVQVDCWADSLPAAQALAAAVRPAMAVAPLYGLPLLALEDYDSTTQMYRVIQDFSIWSTVP
jgi:hypothetical protein